MYEEVKTILEELLSHDVCKDTPKILVVGCSTSEVTGKTMGTASNPEAAEALYENISEVLKRHNDVYLAVQCCEHLNRAIVMEEKLRKELRIPAVNVVPHPHAGGAFATCAYHKMEHPCVVEHVRACFGIDIGEVFIGMHMQEVVVPLKSEVKYIGEARVKAGYSRNKYIGGERAKYE